MKYYLSSYRLGNETNMLEKLIAETSGKFAYIPNALDFTSADPIRREKHISSDMSDFESHGASIELLDLKKYFGDMDKLKNTLSNYGGVYVSGGNTFVLRQAMKLSGLDKILLELADKSNFLYVAYSAGVCVLTPSLKPYAITDDANNFPYKQMNEQVWDGLNILSFAFEPHYQSEHPESASTDKEIQHCIDSKILFKAYRDGEVLIKE
ncbi:MAG: peptidase E [Candidatus Roizmanbacteria bacterium]|nr:peptidase E [Candidatus Roizmanbacteria bacterium]